MTAQWDPQTTNDYWDHYIRIAQQAERQTAAASG
jgi:hypothetical protein